MKLLIVAISAMVFCAIVAEVSKCYTCKHERCWYPHEKTCKKGEGYHDYCFSIKWQNGNVSKGCAGLNAGDGPTFCDRILHDDYFGIENAQVEKAQNCYYCTTGLCNKENDKVPESQEEAH